MLEILILIIFFLSLFGLFRYARDISHPYFWSNLLFLLYGVSLVYLAITGIEGARFLVMAGVEIDFYSYLAFSAFIILVSKLSMELLSRGIGESFFIQARKLRVSLGHLVLMRGVAVVLCAIGIVYWVYVTVILTGGSFQILSNIGVFKHVIKDSGLSTIWFHLVYVGAQLWFLSYFLTGQSRGWGKYIFLIPAFVVMLSTGRLSQSFLFLLAPILFVIFNADGKVSLRRVLPLAIVGVVAIVFLYFFRQLTSYSYIGQSDDFFSLISGAAGVQYIVGSLIGGGNLPDPQQLILILDGVFTGRLSWVYGLSYFDWLVNFFSSGEVQSVGYRILNAYFPEKVGGPTPGAAGEALLNFGPFFPLFLMLVGNGFVWFHRKAKRSGDIFLRFVYIKVLLHFWVLYIKVDSSLVLGVMWQIIPITVVWVLLVHKDAKKPDCLLR